jgi:hypothetical protein
VCDIEDVAGHTPASVGDSEQWSSIVNTADEKRHNFCKALNWKTLFSALYGTYTLALQQLKALLKASSPAGKSETTKCAASQEDGLKKSGCISGTVPTRSPRLERKQRVPPKSHPPRRMQPSTSSPP